MPLCATAADNGAMIELSQSVVVPRSPAEVFAHLERPEHYGAWLPGIRSVTVTSGDALGVGTPLAFEFDGPSGKPIAATGTVTDFVPPERIGLKASARELRFTASFTLAPVEARGYLDHGHTRRPPRAPRLLPLRRGHGQGASAR